MSATVSGTGGWQPQDFKTQLSPGATIKLTASASAGYGQNLYFSDSLGSVALNDGTVPGLVSAGVCTERLAGPNALEGGEAVTVHQGVGGKQAASTIANDGFTALDFLTVAFDAGNGVPGKLSNYGGSNRSIMGLVLGVDRDLAPYVWTGPIASLMARSLLLLKAKTLGWYAHPVDGSAGTTTAEKSIHREPVHGTITAVKFVSQLGTLAADNTDYVGINVYKADGAGGTHVLVASYDSRAANQGAIAAGVPVSFALSAVAGALNLLETDVLSYEVTKGGSGKIVPVGVLTVIGKVI